MAIAILPPGNKFKILTAYEVIQLGEVLKASSQWNESIRNLEDTWRQGENIYDIDLLSTTATPLSEMRGYQRGEDGEAESKKKQIAKDIQRKRARYRRRPTVPKKRKQEQQKKKVENQEEVPENVEVVEGDFQQCGQGTEEWNALFENPELYERLLQQSLVPVRLEKDTCKKGKGKLDAYKSNFCTISSAVELESCQTKEVCITK